MAGIAIWVFGLLASGIFGSWVGQQLEYMDGGIWGFFVGAFAFVCIRPWLTDTPR